MRNFISIEVAQVILARVDARLNCSLDQLRKSTDRAYTMTGFLLTCFTGLTAFIVNTHDIIALCIAIVLWVGVSYALGLMFVKVISVHEFKYAGSSAEGYMQDYNIRISKRKTDGSLVNANEFYHKNILLDYIEKAEKGFQFNKKQLDKRCQLIDKAMRAIKWSVCIDCLIALTLALTKAVSLVVTII